MNVNKIKNFDLGVPDVSKHWALYEPVLGRFLYVSSTTDISILDDIRMLCSSRYNLFLCNLQGAVNYDSNLIDNTCCDNWAMTNTINTTKILSAYFDVEKLVPSSTTEIENSFIQDQKQWIQLLSFWVQKIRHIKRWDMIDCFIDQNLGMNPSDRSKTINELLRQIQLELYLGIDIESTENKIIHLIDQFDKATSGAMTFTIF